MRALLFAILCFSMAVCIIADFELGQRQEGDYIITNRTIFKPAIPFIPMKANILVRASLNEAITHVRVSNIGGRNTNFIHMSGAAGTRSVYVFAIGKPGEGMLIKVEAAAINLNTITSPAPTTTPPETTTEEVEISTIPVSSEE
ncbi:uncharacterized protein LOC116847539 [Odontomachus brunneus]|uniref:uncharacterized protein LOC116847539 n=1 Tax=Odontomachus brunneus TaxID=486640 RepID=UPI0013F198F7|nr:uncharacterized protein LOC116847539 [Odontomachus brunneus]